MSFEIFEGFIGKLDGVHYLHKILYNDKAYGRQQQFSHVLWFEIVHHNEELGDGQIHHPFLSAMDGMNDILEKLFQKEIKKLIRERKIERLQ